jgi:ribonuclease BN (tRNA processing enzyme)
MAIRLHVLGVGDAFTERYHNACLCVEDTDTGVRLQIDCPPAFPRVLADHRARTGSDLSAANLDHLLLTHLHGDHCGGTEAFLYLRRFVFGKKPTLYGASPVLDALWPTRLRGGMERLLLSLPETGVTPAGYIDSPEREQLLIDRPGPLKELTLADYTERVDLLPTATPLGRLRIERRFTRHHIPTTALRIWRAGDARPLFGYSADTAFDPDLIAWLAEAPLFIHETNYGVHTPLSSLLTLPAEVRARMRLIHYPDQLDVDSAPIPCLREGQILTLAD